MDEFFRNNLTFCTIGEVSRCVKERENTDYSKSFTVSCLSRPSYVLSLDRFFLSDDDRHPCIVKTVWDMANASEIFAVDLGLCP